VAARPLGAVLLGTKAVPRASSKIVSQTRLRSPFPRCAVGDKVPSFRDSEAAAVEKRARARARAPSRVEGRPLFAGGAGGGTGEISGCCNNLDPRTPGRVALSHAIECGEYNATELPQAVSKTFPSTPPIHTTEAQMTKRFLAFEARHKGSSRFSGLPGVPPKVAGPGGGGG